MAIRIPALVIAALAAGAGITRAQDVGAEDIGRATWIAGCWERDRGPSVTRERWEAPRGGMMVGTSQTVRAGETVEYEFLRLFVRDGRLVYEAHPSGQVMNHFTATHVADTAITFADPEHDFPQRITYVRVGSDSLVARISGLRGGVERGVDFAFQRVPCERPG